MEIRKLNPTDDKAAICRIYKQSWKAVYKDIIPDEYLDSITSEKWIVNLDRAGLHHLVMLEDDIFIGTAAYCKSRSAELADYGEIVSIYLLPEYCSKGYGRQLLNKAVDELSKLGYHDVFLWVLEENRNARAFYEKCGFVCADVYLTDNIGGKVLREVQYRFCKGS